MTAPPTTVGTTTSAARPPHPPGGSAAAPSPARVFLRLALHDALRSRWLVFVSCAYGALFAGFVWLGLRESSVLGFTGLSRVVLNVANAIVVITPLLALVATSQSIVGARATGLFELLLSQPARRGAFFAGLFGSRLLVLAGPLALGLVACAIAALAAALVAGPKSVLAGASDPALLPTIARGLAVTVALIACFIGVGLYLSSIARTPDRAVVYALLAFLAATAIHDFALIGVLLRARLPPEVVFAIAAANPVEAARVALLSSVDPELAVLGPVGFWLATRLGPGPALAIGICWPLAAGSLALLAAARRFQRGDLVG